MKWFYWSLMSVILLAGIGVSVYFGIQPKPVPKITLSGFENPEEMGQSIVKRLRLEIQAAPIVYLGVIPEQKAHYQIWQEFLKVSQEPSLKYDLLIIEKNLPYQESFDKTGFAQVEVLDLKQDFDRLAQGLKKAAEQKMRVAVLAPSIYISTLLKGNTADRLKSESGVKAVSFSTSTFPLNSEQEKNMDIPCILNEQDHSGAGPLGCFVAHSARPFYRKKKVINKYPGAVNQVGAQEYLVIFNPTKYSK